jgi:hypothetical protein
MMQKRTFLYTLLPTCLVFTGCATDPATMQMALDAQNNVRPTLELTCPAGGCQLKFTDPRDRQGVRLPTNGWDFAGKVVDTTGAILQGAIVPAAFAYTAVKGMEAMKGHGTTTNNTTTTSTNTESTHTSTTTQTLSGTGTLGSGAYTNTDSTSTPVVVTQPAPTIVTQPAPVIVNPVIVGP